MSMDDGDADVRAGMPSVTHRRGARNASDHEKTASNATVVKENNAPTGQTNGNDLRELMPRILSRENMLAALRVVKRNGGAAGVDNMTVEALTPWLITHWEQTKAGLLAGQYRPQAVKRVDIPKPGGGTRMLGIPTVLDRMIQQAIHQVLSPIWEPHFSAHSYGFRPGHSAHQAVQAAKSAVTDGHRWVVDIDLEKFFDRVNHDILMARIARRVKDKVLLRLLRRYLEAGMMMGGIIEPRTEGTPQGGPLCFAPPHGAPPSAALQGSLSAGCLAPLGSPLLSNILLDDLDKELERRGHRFARYADDCNIYVKSKAAGVRVLESVTEFVEKKLKLKVNAAKSAVDRPWNRKFLGYSMTTHKLPKLKAAAASVQSLKDKVRDLCRQGKGRNLESFIEQDLNPLLRGWATYYRLAGTKVVYTALDAWVRRRIRCLKWRQWKRPRIRMRELQKLGCTKQEAIESAYNGRGPWFNSGTQIINAALPLEWFTRRKLVSMSQIIHRYGPT